MMTYDIELYKDDKLIRSTNISINGQSLTMEEVATHAHRLFMVAGYDKEFDGFSVYDPSDGPNSRNLYVDLLD